jgi:stage IV sporulation protein FB
MQLFQIKGIPIRAHWSMLLMMAGLTGWQLQNGWYAALEVMVGVTVLFGIILLHELAHVFVARDFGFLTRDVTLYPFGGIAAVQLDPDPVSEFYIALAGPVCNAFLCLLFLALNFVGVPYAGHLAMLNFVICVFNLMPSFPMDGGRVFRSLLARRIPFEDATKYSLRLSMVLSMGYVVAGILIGWIGLTLIGVFLLFVLYTNRGRSHW